MLRALEIFFSILSKKTRFDWRIFSLFYIVENRRQIKCFRQNFFLHNCAKELFSKCYGKVGVTFWLRFHLIVKKLRSNF